MGVVFREFGGRRFVAKFGMPDLSARERDPTARAFAKQRERERGDGERASRARPFVWSDQGGG